MNREAIYAALFNLVANVPGIVVAERRLRHWNDVRAVEQPYLCVTQGNQTATQGSPVIGVNAKWQMEADIYIYVQTTGKQVPGTVLNPILDAIEQALAPPFPDINKCQTLGGLVEHCWIEGTIETDEGTLGDQAVAIIPVHILAT